jgi:hypothetical protein
VPLNYHHVPWSIPTCNKQFENLVPLKFDPEAARAELAKSKYASEIADMQLNVTLGMFGQPVGRNVIQMQAIQKMLQDNLGLKNIVIHQEPMADYTKPTYPTHIWPNAQGEHTTDVLGFMNNLAALIAPLPDDESKMNMLTLPYVPELAAKMKEAEEQVTLDGTCEKLAEAQQIWVDSVFTLDLFNPALFRAVAPWVKNLHLTGGGQPGIDYAPGKTISETWIAKH